MYKVYLDPGHGTLLGGVHDPGAVAGDLREDEVALDVARRVAALLPPHVEAKLSRTDNRSPKGIDARAGEANAWGADMVLSIHCNSFTAPTASGVEALVLAFGGRAEAYADTLLKYCTWATGIYSRGVKARQELGILRRTAAPAVLLELGFLTNAWDAAMLRDRRADVAQGVANGILACAQLAGHHEEVIDADIKDTTVKVGDATVAGKLIDGTTYVPLRDIVEALRPVVTWAAEEGAKVTL